MFKLYVKQKFLQMMKRKSLLDKKVRRILFLFYQIFLNYLKFINVNSKLRVISLISLNIVQHETV